MPIPTRIEPGAHRLSLSAGERLVDACDAAATVPLWLSCRAASCGVCRVAVERGEALLAPAGATERRVLEALKAGSHERLGCQLRVRECINTDISPDRDGERVVLRLITPDPAAAASHS